MADTWTKLYTDLRTKLVQLRGQGAIGRTGAALPKTFAHDPFVFLALLWPDMSTALDKITGGWANPYETETQYRAELAGQSVGSIPNPAAPTIPDPVRASFWLTRGKAVPGKPLVRIVPVALGFGVPFHVIAGGSRASVAEIELLVGKWNACIDRAAVSLSKMATHPMLGAEETVEWWSSMYQLMVAIEIITEYPRPGSLEMLVGGIKEAAQASVDAVQKGVEQGAELAGRAAAELAETAGKAAGAAAEGFFDQAGLTAYLVVGIALVIALH